LPGNWVDIQFAGLLFSTGEVIYMVLPSDRVLLRYSPAFDNCMPVAAEEASSMTTSIDNNASYTPQYHIAQHTTHRLI
jgi:hypothetical protein